MQNAYHKACVIGPPVHTVVRKMQYVVYQI